MTQEMMEFWDALVSVGPYANNLHLAADRNHTNTSLSFYMPYIYGLQLLQFFCKAYNSLTALTIFTALPDSQPTVSKH